MSVLWLCCLFAFCSPLSHEMGTFISSLLPDLCATCQLEKLLRQFLIGSSDGEAPAGFDLQGAASH